MAVAPTPVAAAPDAPDRAQRATFSARATAFFDWIKNTFVAGVNALASNVYANAQDAASSAANAVAQSASATAQAGIATAQAAAATSAAATATTQAGVATTQAASITAAAATSTAKADVATAKAAEATAAAATATAITLGVSTGYPIIRSSLTLDFANSQIFDPRITFTRASAATRINEKGLVETVAANVPRLDFDPVTLACRGLLIEEARTNLLTYTDNIASSAWVKGLNTVFAVEGISPVDGSSYYYSIRSTGVVGNLFTAKSFTAPTTGTYALSAWVKVDDATLAASSNRLISVFVNSDGTRFLSYVAAGLVAGVWKRVSYSFTANSGDNITLNFGYDFSTNTGVKLYFCHPQIEFGEFPTSYIPSTVTHTGRASTATFIGSNGLIQTAASGVARYSYNPLNLSAAPALLLEEARTNLLTYSEQFDNAAWTKTNATVTANATTDPDGTLTADKLVEDTTASSGHSIYEVLSLTATTMSLFVYAKAAERSWLVLNLWDGAANHGRFFDVANGVIGATTLGNPTSGEITSVGNGWYKCTITCTCAAVPGNVSIFVSTGDGVTDYTGDGTSGLYIWGAQLEAGSYPTSYIPTTSAQVTRAADTSTSAVTTRAADVATMTGANFSSWFRPDEGTLTTEFACLTSNQTAYLRVFSVNDGTAANETTVLLNASTDKAYAAITSTTSLVFDTGGTANGNVLVSANTPIRAALAYKLNDFACSMNGGAAQTDSTGNPSVGVYQLRIGTVYGGDQLSGHIRSLRYYPKRLTNAELQALTA